MLHFTVSLKTPFGIADFVFNRIFIGKGGRYHVSVRDESGRSIFFNMDLKDKEWYVVNAPKIPDWITCLEIELSTAIIENNGVDKG